MNQADHRSILRSVFDAAVASAQPERCLPPYFPAVPASGRLIVLACGKAGAAMARAAEGHYADAIERGVCSGLAVTRSGYGLPLAHFALMEASHPVPDQSSADAAIRALDLAGEAREGDLVLALMSGGASALWAAPADGLALSEKQDLTRALLRAGAPIGAINCVRKHLSRIKGGRLARAACPARVVTLAISDVPGDAPDTIGSGPTVPDATTLADARRFSSITASSLRRHRGRAAILQTKPPSRAIRPSPIRNSSSPARPNWLSMPLRPPSPRSAMSRCSWAMRSRARRAMSPAPMPRWRWRPAKPGGERRFSLAAS